MPTIPRENFSNWYVVNLDGTPVIIRSYNETLEQEIQDVKYLQSDLGTKIVNIGPQKFNLSMESPLLILDHENSADSVADVLDFSLGYLESIQQPIFDSSNFNYVIKSVNIQLAQDCTVNTQLESWSSFADYLSYAPESLDFTARTVKNYDVQISIFNSNFLISSGTLNIRINSSANYFVSNTNETFGNKTPIYAILGYTVTGDVTLMLTPEQYDLLKFYNDQSRGFFTAARHNIYLTILDRFNPNREFRRIDLGNFMFLPSVELNVSANEAITARFNFITMFRKTSILTY